MEHPWWPLIFALVSDLDQAAIPYSLDAATALLAQGIDVPGMDDIDISVQPDFLDQAYRLFRPYDPTPIQRHEGWATFRFQLEGVPVDILAYEGTVLATDPDRVAVEHGGRRLYAKSLDFFYRHSPPGHWRRRLIDQNRPPLYGAAIRGDTEAAALLLAHGADIDGTDTRGQTPLHGAAAGGWVAMIDWLLDHGATKNPYSEFVGLPLHLAAKEGRDEAVRLLLYRGADIRKPDPQGRSAQDLARERGHMALAEYLDEFLRNDNPQAWGHAISLSAAATREYFCQHRDQVNTVRYHGHSPLGLAAHLGDPERVSALLELGAELSPEAAIVLGQREFVQEWLQRNPLRVNARSIEGRDQPLLYFAAIMGNVAIAQLLLDHGAEIDGAHKSGSTVLFHAAACGRSEMVRFLAAHGADVNKATRWGFTPLHEAAHKGDLAMARMLVEAGADPAARSKDGETVLDAAETGGNAALLTWLRQVLSETKG